MTKTQCVTQNKQPTGWLALFLIWIFFIACWNHIPKWPQEHQHGGRRTRCAFVFWTQRNKSRAICHRAAHTRRSQVKLTILSPMYHLSRREGKMRLLPSPWDQRLDSKSHKIFWYSLIYLMKNWKAQNHPTCKLLLFWPESTKVVLKEDYCRDICNLKSDFF